MLAWVYVAIGLVMLLCAGDFLVKGAVHLAMRLGIPAFIVSLTIVAFGTSAPELLIVLSAIYEGAPGLAVGNVVGSNTANVLLVLGLPALLATIDTRGTDTRSSYRLMIIATLAFIALAFVGPFIWWHGVIFLAILAYMLTSQAKKAKAAAQEPRGADKDLSRRKIA